MTPVILSEADLFRDRERDLNTWRERLAMALFLSNAGRGKGDSPAVPSFPLLGL